ncbi:MAG TPA: tetratricopeptide repeat protein [Bryobacteraceae bacterium]|jgi:tetratricopeptide (TPR) repeat protein
MHFSRPALLILVFSGAAVFAQQTPTPSFARPFADTLVDNNHYKRARTVVEARLRENPNDAHALFLSSKIQEALGNLHGALALAEKSVAIDPNNVSYHAQLAECYAYTADRSTWVKGIGYVHLMKKEIAAALELHPHDSDTLLVAMMFAFHAPSLAGGDRKKAHEIADEIRQYDPHWGWLAEARLAQEDSTDENIEVLLKKAVQADPRHYRALREMANFYCCVAKRKNPVETERVGHLMVALDPNQASGYAALASAYARSGRWAELDAVLAQSEKAVPDDLTPYYQAAAALIDSGQDLARAEKYLTRYASQEPEGREPDRVQTKWLLASLYEKNGRTPDAIRELEAAVRMRPDFEPAKKDLKRLRATS